MGNLGDAGKGCLSVLIEMIGTVLTAMAAIGILGLLLKACIS